MNNKKDISRCNVCPKSFYPFLYDLNPYINVKSCDFRGREKEVERIYNCLLKKSKANAILLGEHGVGKNAIINTIMYNVITKKAPKEIQNFHFLYLDLPCILNSLSSRWVERKLNSIFEFLEKYSNLVLVIHQIHMMEYSLVLSNIFAKLVRLSNVKIIGTSTEEEFYECFEFDTRTRARLEIINVKEPTSKKLYPMIIARVKSLEKQYRVRINRDLIDYISFVSAAFQTELCNPELTLNTIEKSMIVSKRKGLKEVSKECINSNFNFNYELFSKISMEDKKIIAYHEAGHFIVSKMSENIHNLHTTAITIVPAEDFLGVTMFEYEYEKQTSLDMEYYVDIIASDLGGRIAENILLAETSKKKYTSGACQDLINATNTAREIVTKYGMAQNIGENMAYLNDFDFTNLYLLSDDIKNKIDEETKSIINTANGRATQILEANKDLLERIANELIKNQVLDYKDLDLICKEVIDNREK